MATYQRTFCGRRAIDWWSEVRDNYLPQERAERLVFWEREQKSAQELGDGHRAREIGEVIAYEQAHIRFSRALDAINHLLKGTA